MSIQADKIIAVRTSKTVYRNGDTVIKVFDEAYSKADVLNEARNQACIEEAGLHIPKIIEVLKINDKWAIISEFIPGEILQQLLKNHPEKRDEYLELFVQLQIQIQSLEVPLLNLMKDKMKRNINQSTLDAATRNALHARLESMPDHRKLSHGDFCPSNIIISDDGSPFILDWSHASLGNASADVAQTYLLFCLNGETDKAEKYVDLFCELSNTAQQDVQKWLPIIAASQSIKVRLEERKFLLRWVNAMDND
jgi:tRNA A-37 threonylcarbamoyl transferase component Bud32